MVIDLLPGSHNATVTEFTDSVPTTDCHVGGFLGSVCGEQSLHGLELTEDASATGTAADGNLHISGMELKMTFGERGSCLLLILSGGLSATLDSTTAADTAQLSGELESAFGPLSLAGDLKITPNQAGVYGIETVE